MADEFLSYFGWITPLTLRPVPECFDRRTAAYAIIRRFVEGWGRMDTVELLSGLSADYGQEAGEAVERFLEYHIRKDWKEIGEREAHQGTEIDDFIRVLWEPLADTGFAFTIDRAGEDVKFNVTKCPVAELGERTGMRDWVYRLACSTDLFTSTAFSPAIRFSRTETMTRGSDRCNHRYRSGN